MFSSSISTECWITGKKNINRHFLQALRNVRTKAFWLPSASRTCRWTMHWHGRSDVLPWTPWACLLRRMSAAPWSLESRIRITLRAWIFVSCACCVGSCLWRADKWFRGVIPGVVCVCVCVCVVCVCVVCVCVCVWCGVCVCVYVCGVWCGVCGCVCVCVCVCIWLCVIYESRKRVVLSRREL